jgi:hypothetical protein
MAYYEQFWDDHRERLEQHRTTRDE